MAKKVRLQVKGRIRRGFTARKISKGRIAERGYKIKPEPKNLLQKTTRVFGSSLRKVWEKDRGISGYEYYLGFSIERIVGKKFEALGRPVRILDVGCGNCYFSAELRDLFGNKVELEGISLAKPLTPKKWAEKSERMRVPWRHMGWEWALRKMGREFHERVKAKQIKVHTGLAETHDYGKKFDLIFSVQTIRHTTNPVQALVNTLNHLAIGGEAYIHLTLGAVEGRRTGLLKKKIRGKGLGEWLKEQGIEITSLKPGVCRFVKANDAEIRIPGV